MRCEDVELALLEGPLAPEQQRHLEGCASCQAFAAEVHEVTQLAANEPLTAVDRAALAQVADGVLKAWQPISPARPSWVGYATAAGLGAFVAASGFWFTRPVREVVVERAAPIVQVAQATDDSNLSSDDVFFEVTWPDLSDPSDGEAP